jgi:hypothetical protein
MRIWRKKQRLSPERGKKTVIGYAIEDGRFIV